MNIQRDRSLSRVFAGFGALLFVAVLTVMTATPTLHAQDDTTICFSYESLESQFWVAGHKAITQTLKSRGVNVIDHNSNGSANRQLEQVKDCISQDVDGIILIPTDGQLAVEIAGIANEAGVPIAVFNRPPASKKNNAIVVVADNRKISRKAMQYMADLARERYEETGEKVKPLHLVGDLGDPNAVGRRKGFYDVIEANPEIFTDPVEAPSKWDAATAQRNLEAALSSHPDVGLLFAGSEFLYPQVKAVLRQKGMWHKRGHPDHVILGGVDGNQPACKWIKSGYADASAVQDLFLEAEMTMDRLLEAIEKGEKAPEDWMEDPGFALTPANWEERAMDMWGCKLVAEERGVESMVD